MRNLILLSILFSLISCSQKLTRTIIVDGIKIERLNINYLNNITSSNLQPNVTLTFGVDKFEDDFWIVKKTYDSLTTIYVKKTGNKINEIDKQQFNYKGSEVRSKFYSDGKLKNRISTIRIDTISNKHFEKITVGSFLNEYLSFNTKGHLDTHFDFDRDFKFKLEELVIKLSKMKELKGTEIGIGTGYINEFGVSGDIGLSQAKKIVKNYPYWYVIYPNELKTSAYILLVFDGKTGILIEKVLVQIQSID